MALNVSAIHKAMVRAFGASTSSQHFNDDFIQAVNNSLDELTFSAALTTAHTHITGTNSDITTLDGQDSYILQAGVVVYLCMAGWPHRAMADDSRFLAAVALPMWVSAKGDAMVRQSRDDDQESADMDDDGAIENDIIGLGYIGDE